MASSPRLQQRRLAELPLHGSEAVYTAETLRDDDAFTAEALADLISSIGQVGQLQPILVEDRGGAAASRGRYRLVVGERRLRALRWGATTWPNHPHFATALALVCPGPLSEAERRRWRVHENLAREKLRPGELGTALVIERTSVLLLRLRRAGVEVPATVTDIADPIERFEAAERLRAGRSELAVPWREVLGRLGIQMSARKARAIVAAYRALPPQVSASMDAHEIALSTRSALLQATKGHVQAAEEIWSAVAEAGRPDLLSAAATAHVQENLTGRQAVRAAERILRDANAARAAKLTVPPAAAPGRAPVGDAARAPAHADTPAREVDAAVLEQALRALRELVAQLRSGHQVERHAAGSLRLLLEQTHELLGRQR